MRVLVNALSVTNLSGKHVLLGHLSMLAAWTDGLHEYIVLYHRENNDICRDLGSNVRWVECPSYTSQWIQRSLWEFLRLPALASKLKIDLMFLPSGITVDNCSIPQISFAQNPWCLVDGLERSPTEKIKAFLQKKAYRKAMEKASVMIFNSEYMRRAYRENAGFAEKHSLVVYQGIDEATFAAAEEMRNKIARKPLQVVCVSAMAPHKGVETLVEAIRLLHERHGVPASLTLVGAWPDRKYESFIRRRVLNSGLEDVIEFRGHVSKEDLHRAYAESKVFCLMSRCESFGIPAVEAQAFGTPVVSSNCCAIAEVCGAGGLYTGHDDSEEVASALHTLLTETAEWKKVSEAAVANTARFRWDVCSRPLMSMFKVISGC